MFLLLLSFKILYTVIDLTCESLDIVTTASFTSEFKVEWGIDINASAFTANTIEY